MFFWGWEEFFFFVVNKLWVREECEIENIRNLVFVLYVSGGYRWEKGE